MHAVLAGKTTFKDRKRKIPGSEKCTEEVTERR
jgi:hypothetical protein